MVLQTRNILQLIAVFAISVLASLSSANVTDRNQWQFEVLLDNKKIGYHDFVIEEQNGNQTIDSKASFDVKILFVNVFRYRHQTREIWQNNCLASIDAETDANGKDFVVQGQVSENQFLLQSAPAANELPPCIMTFAYWNPDFLTATQLLNSQTGEYESVSISNLGSDTRTVNGQVIQAVKYKVDVKAGPITLWYAADDHRWLALESKVKGGRTLRYEPIQIPDSIDTFHKDNISAKSDNYS